MDALLIEVYEDTQGSQAVAVTPVGGSEVTVDDMTDFPDEGGVIDVLGVRYDYTSVVPGAPILDGAGDFTQGGTLLLTTPVTAQVDEGDPVQLVVGDQVATDAVAVIDFHAGDSGDAPDGGDTVRITLDRTQRLAFPIGQYDPPLPVVVADDLTAVLSTPGSTPAMDGALLVEDSVPGPALMDGAVLAAKLADAAVQTSKIAPLAVTATVIADDAITTPKIAANAVTANEIAAGAVVAGKIAAGAITANEIAASAVTATQLAANAVVAGKIAANAVTATTIAAGAVAAGKIAAGAIDGMTITGALIRTAATGKRWELASGSANIVKAYSGSPDETSPGGLTIDYVNGGAEVSLAAPAVTGVPPASVRMVGHADPGASSNMYLKAQYVTVEASQSFEVYDTALVNAIFRASAGAGGVYINDTKLVRAIDFGSFSSTANANGDLAVTHNLGRVPSSVIVVPMQTGALRQFSVVAVSSTAFTVRSRSETGATVASGAAIAGYFLAFA